VKAISMAEWETRLTYALPEELHASLPTTEQVEAARRDAAAAADGDRETGSRS